MKTDSVLCLAQLLVVTCLAGDTPVGELGFGAAGFGNGVGVRIATKVEPPQDPTEIGVANGYAVDEHALHRSLVDHAHSAYFGYDIFIEPLDNSKKCRVIISPLGSTKPDGSAGHLGRGSASAGGGGRASFSVPANYRCVALPKYPAPQIVSAGDTLALDLLVSSDGREKITDYITVVITDPRPPSEGVSMRDFSLQDIAMHIEDPSWSLNGAAIVGGSQSGEFIGHFFWFSVPGKGRFIVSPTPNAAQGFEKMGMIRGNALLLRLESEDYEIRSRITILDSASSQSWNAYVLHDRGFEPTSGGCGSAMQLGQLFAH